MNIESLFHEHLLGGAISVLIFATLEGIPFAVLWEAIKKLFTPLLKLTKRLSAEKKFERKYRDWLINKFRFLNVRGIKVNALVAIELEKVFISLKAKRPSDRMKISKIEYRRQEGTNHTPKLVEFGSERFIRRTEEQEIKKTYELKDVFNLRHRKFIIIGPPGSGKTTLLNYLALKFARKTTKELFGFENEILPICVNLRDAIGEGFLDEKTFAEKYENYIKFPNCPEGLFEKRLEQGECIILLDGLDEVAEEKQRLDVAKWVDELTTIYPRNIFIAASRPYGYETARLYNDFFELHILDFTTEQVERFVRDWAKAVEIKAREDEGEFTLKEADKKAEDILKAIKENPKIEVLTVNPLMLTIVCSVSGYKAPLPKRRVELYEECCDVLLGHWDLARGMAAELQPRQKRAVLQPIAFHLHRNRIKEEKREEFIQLLENELPKIGVPEEQADDFLEDIKYRSGILVETKLGFLGFSHLTFQEFLTARHIFDYDLEDFLVPKKRDKYWLEVTLLYCGMKDTTNLLQKILKEKEDIFHTNFFLAGRCLAESLKTSPKLRSEITEKLFDLYWDENEFKPCQETCLEILKEIKDHHITVKCIEKTKDKEGYVRQRAAYALGEIQVKEAALPLTELLEDKEKAVRGSAARALGRIQAKEALSALIELLKDKETDVRECAASALRQIQAKEAVLPLMELLKDKEGDVRGSAAYALGQIQAKEAALPLIGLLKDRESSVRWSAAFALGQMQAKDAILHLIELLKDKESDVRGAAASALGQIQAKEAIVPLIRLLKDKERYVRWSAAFTLSQIPGKEAVLPLIGLLSDKERDIRGPAASALGQIQAKEAILPLIELLKDKESYVRWSAAFALGQMQAKEAVSPLIALLKDKESYVRGRAIDALGQIQAKEAVLPLIELLEDKESEVRGSAVDALSHIQAKEALLPLIELLKDKEGDVRGRAALALGQMQAKEAVLALIELLKHEEADVRGRAALALGQMQAKEAVSPLIELLKDKESYVRASTTSALGKIQAKEAVLPLIELLKDKESSVRGHAAYAVGRIGGAKAVEPLKSLLTDTEFSVGLELVKDSAFKVLREISEKTGTPIYPD